MKRSIIMGSLIVIAIAAVTAYTFEVSTNLKLKAELAVKDSINEMQEAEILNLKDVVIERDYELSFWGNVLDQLATNHPDDANKIAKDFGFEWNEVK
jgi:hypothetical protein